ncbi:MAG TPA: NADH:flavin oxidoreductase, partial [Phycisphaerae bacterium]|nr:NADH:flavin oxidoreductase [Phycisphaerae bacterium]
MAQPHRFAYRSLHELKDEISRRDLDLPTSDDLSILATPVSFGRLTVPNRFAAQPMEGCDGGADGAPGELTVRKYRRLAAGGVGMIWFEACAVVPEGRANPRQLWLHEGTAGAFAAMVRATRQAAADAGGPQPVLVLQLTHSGRYSRPVDKPAPIIAHHSAVLDPRHNLPADYPLISDERLDALQDDFVRAALLAAEAGFDAVDLKSCHRYLLSELLASFTRADSRYGGSYENRTRMLRETSAKVRRAVGTRVEVTSRLNAFDAIAHPYGWGVSRNDALRPDLSEPVRLIGELREAGCGGINITIGNPYS